MEKHCDFSYGFIKSIFNFKPTLDSSCADIEQKHDGTTTLCQFLTKDICSIYMLFNSNDQMDLKSHVRTLILIGVHSCRNGNVVWE